MAEHGAPGWPSWVKASALWHGAMAAGLVAVPAHAAWWVGGLLANHLVLTGASVTPRSRLLGPNLRRLPPSAAARGLVALTFDDGPDPEVTPRVLEILAQAGHRATFFCIGDKLVRYPELARQIVAGGHTIENHTQSHRHSFAFRGVAGLRAEIDAAQQSIGQIVGRRPAFFRAPAGMRNPWLEPVLRQLDLQLVSWTRRGYDAVRGGEAGVLARLTKRLAAGDILVLHDGHAARTAAGDPVVLKVLPPLSARLQALGLHSVPLREAVGQGEGP